VKWNVYRDQELALTYDPEPGSETPLDSEEELLAVLTAVANPLRLRVIAELRGGRVHVSELARRLGISRPLLYMHLDRLEKAGLVTGHLELSEDGKAMKYFELAPFELRLTADVISGALRSGSNGAPQSGQTGHHDHGQTKESNT
jgi:DNA-binding transcriptional ArsR family regulator